MSEKYIDEWKTQALVLAASGMSWRKVAETLCKPKTTVSDYLRSVFSKKMAENNHPTETFSVRRHEEDDNSRILFISDLHIPYHHPDSISFLSHLKNKYNPTRVVCLGDEVDLNSLSYHEKDPDLHSPKDELELSLPVIQELHTMFPKMNIIESNHGSLVWRKAKTAGIPKHYIKSYNDMLGVGEGWKWSFDLTLTLPNGQKCYVHHGKVSNVIRLSQMMGMCAIQGHYHERLAVDYWGNPNGLYWAAQAGCLIQDSSYAFNYNNVNVKRPVLGTIVVVDSQPIIEPMVLDSDGKWIRK